MREERYDRSEGAKIDRAAQVRTSGVGTTMRLVPRGILVHGQALEGRVGSAHSYRMRVEMGTKNSFRRSSAKIIVPYDVY